MNAEDPYEDVAEVGRFIRGREYDHAIAAILCSIRDSRFRDSRHRHSFPRLQKAARFRRKSEHHPGARNLL